MSKAPMYCYGILHTIFFLALHVGKTLNVWTKHPYLHYDILGYSIQNVYIVNINATRFISVYPVWVLIQNCYALKSGFWMNEYCYRLQSYFMIFLIYIYFDNILKFWFYEVHECTRCMNGSFITLLFFCVIFQYWDLEICVYQKK